jgi:hypothetical protein
MRNLYSNSNFLSITLAKFWTTFVSAPNPHMLLCWWRVVYGSELARPEFVKKYHSY